MSSALVATGRLRELESVIERGFSTFIEVGNAIGEIRDKELYTAYGTFEDYMRERWGWTRDQGYKQIRGAQIGQLIAGNVDGRIQPTGEFQIRPLARLAALPDFTEGTWIDAWNEAAHLANDGREPDQWHPPTADVVSAVVKEMMGSHDEPPGDYSHVKLLQGRMEDWLPSVGKVPCIITDPPYGTTAHDWDTAEHEKWLALLLDCLAPQFSFFWFCPASLVADTEMVFRRLGLPIQSRIVWHRRNMALGSAAKARFIDTWEMAFHVGNRDLNFPAEWDEGWFDVQTFPVPQSNFEDKKLHPTQKPEGLISRLVRFGSFPGEVVLDPFAGAGTTGVGCPADRSCVLIEREPRFVQVIEQRLNIVGQTRRG